MHKTFMLIVPGCPKSMNAGGSSRHRMAAYREKKQWQQTFESELQVAKVSRGMSRCVVDVTVRWKRRARRDVTNYFHPIIKPFADALVTGGFLADDTDEFFRVGELRFEHPDVWTYADPRVKSEMVFRLEAEYDR